MPATNRKGIFRTALAAYIAAKQRQADHYVANALLSFDDETLKAGGFSRPELQRRSRSAYL